MRTLYLLLACCLASLLAARSARAAEPVEGRLLVTNAQLFTLEPGQEKPFNGYLAVAADGTIASIGPGAAPVGWKATTVVDAKGQWILPGFISAHSHLWQSAYRGLAANQALGGWIQALYLKEAMKAEVSSFYWFTLHGALDHLRHGITSTYNFNYAGVREGPYAQEQFRAEQDSGIRFVHGFNLGRVGPQLSVAEARARLKTFLDWANTQPKTGRLLSVMLNGAAGFSDSPEQASAEAEIAREFGIGNQVHYLETAPGQAEERGKFRWFIDHGLLGPKLVFGHFVHADDWIVETSAKAGVGMSWNPLSNGRLASGTADIPRYLKLGLRVGMGVDGQASADLADAFENMRAGLYAVRAKYEDATVLSPYTMIRLHTLGSADVLGVADKVGSLAQGKLADFIVFDPAELGPIFDPYASLVFAGQTSSITAVYVGGQRVIANGQPVLRDLAEVRAEVNRRVGQP